MSEIKSIRESSGSVYLAICYQLQHFSLSLINSVIGQNLNLIDWGNDHVLKTLATLSPFIQRDKKVTEQMIIVRTITNILWQKFEKALLTIRSKL